MPGTRGLLWKAVEAAWRRLTKTKGVGDVRGTVVEVAASAPAGPGREGSHEHAREPGGADLVQNRGKAVLEPHF